MVPQELSSDAIRLVRDSWQQVRRIKNYEEVAGAVLFQRYVYFDHPWQRDHNIAANP
jgi:hypothetical protein